MFRKAKSVVGLDLGSHVVKAVEITMEGDEPVLTGFARAEVLPGSERSDAIAEVFEQGGFKTRNVVTSVAGQSVVVRYISMAQMSDSELGQAIRFESDKYLPFDADEVVNSYLTAQKATEPDEADDSQPVVRRRDAMRPTGVLLALAAVLILALVAALAYFAESFRGEARSEPPPMAAPVTQPAPKPRPVLEPEPVTGSRVD